jgi:hypothetical protein
VPQHQVLGAYEGMEGIPAQLGKGKLVEWEHTEQLLNKLPLLGATAPPHLAAGSRERENTSRVHLVSAGVLPPTGLVLDSAPCVPRAGCAHAQCCCVAKSGGAKSDL